MKKIKEIIKFKTYREYWDYTNQDIPCTKSDRLDPNKNLVTFMDNSQQILSNEELQKFIDELKNA